MRLIASVAAATLSIASLAVAQEPPAPTAPATPAPSTAPAAAAWDYAVIRTNKGPIVVELDRAKAPLSVENFLAYAKDGFYDGTVFHRVIPGFMIQGGGFGTDSKQKATRAGIRNEWKNGLSNARGTLAMARLGNQPDSATAQFFINLKDNAFLDQPRDGAGYAVFGRVLAGMEVVDAIALVPRGARNGMRDWPTQDIVMEKVEVLTKDEADAMVKSLAPAAPKASEAPTAPASPTAPAAPAAPKKEG
ncbi:MAG: peptidyl-prolyl cis-trans isomerase [Phycisphaera sp.]|nr:peptidyl-prolyl cis-trans isomerase [Phycisphaera sp.]